MITSGTSLTLSRDQLTIEDPHNWVLMVGDGANYTRDGSTISPVDGFVRMLEIPVTCFDGISGRAVIVDERTIRVGNFSYNGGGPDVRVYLGVGNDFVNGPIISDSLSGTVFNNETLELTIPELPKPWPSA
ncbi:DM13 domain-containing protein [Sulfidibacter corallicola]|uniref:DM13 domain-containing protein n=1 Tax=Sulfidibacter corallicola TaxID=2818388 RepID=A0A8A4TUE3_SULCO|nr:DM13 domain-containing protein [Sulfidibacter corallicola]QTD53586.1 DM13 domain-containing protein [Sulfidibacter corallicola]